MNMVGFKTLKLYTHKKSNFNTIVLTFSEPIIYIKPYFFLLNKFLELLA
jgi:hypothetical protein